MIKQIGETWRSFWRMANKFALAVDADPLEDIHRRIRRLEAAFFQSEVEQREPAGVPSHQVRLREQTEHCRDS
jgi:hypothetical protein